MFCKQKNKKTILLFCLICVFNVIDTTAQKVRVLHKKYKFDWSDKIPPYIPVEEQFMNEDAVILKEETNLTILESRFYEWYYNISIKKYLRIKYLTENGIKNYSDFVLPYLDPIIYNNIEAFYFKEDPRVLGGFGDISYFAGRIIKPDGSIKAAIFEQKYYEEKITNYHYRWYDELSFTYHFTIKNLEVNDEVEIYYKCIRYGVADYYFNSSIPKQNFKLNLTYPRYKKYVFLYHHNAGPSDSVLFAKKKILKIKMVWERKNLHGYKDKPGAYPYKRLPYISFYYQPIRKD